MVSQPLRRHRGGRRLRRPGPRAQRREPVLRRGAGAGARGARGRLPLRLGLGAPRARRDPAARQRPGDAPGPQPVTHPRRPWRCSQAAALAGDRLDPAVLALAAGATADEVDDTVRAGLDLQLLVEHRDGGRPEYRFRHALTREAFADELVGPDRRRTHRRLAEALVALHGQDDALAATVADHFDRRGRRRGGPRARPARGQVRRPGRRRRRGGPPLRPGAAPAAGRPGRRRPTAGAAPGGSGVRRHHRAEPPAGGVRARGAGHGGGALRPVRAGSGDQRARARALARRRRRGSARPRARGLRTGARRRRLPRGLGAAPAVARAASSATGSRRRRRCIPEGIELAERSGQPAALAGLHGTRMMSGSYGPGFHLAGSRRSPRPAPPHDPRAEHNIVINTGYVGAVVRRLRAGRALVRGRHPARRADRPDGPVRRTPGSHGCGRCTGGTPTLPSWPGRYGTRLRGRPSSSR